MHKLHRALRAGIICAYCLFFITACVDEVDESLLDETRTENSDENKPKNTFNFSISTKVGEGGTLTPAAQLVGANPKPGTVFVDENGIARFDVRAKRGFTIKEVTGCNGAISGEVNLFSAKTYATGVLTADCTITATFRKILVNTVVGGGGTLNLPDPLFDLGGKINFFVNPASGYVVNNVTGCGAKKLAGGFYFTEVIVNDCTIRASFTNLNPLSVETGIPLVSTGSNEKMYPKTSMDANGNVITLWLHNDGLQYVIQAKRYIEGIGWGEIEIISKYADRIFSPQIAMNDNGNAIAVWSQSDGIRYNIWASHYVVDVGWSEAEVIETNNYVKGVLGFLGRSVGAFSPKVAIDNKNNAVVVWHQRGSNTENDIWSNRYDYIEGWGESEVIGTKNNGQVQEAQVVVDSNGGAIAVWKNFSSSKHKIQANRYVNNIGWGEAEYIDNNVFIGVQGDIARILASGAASPQIAVDGNGNVIAIWAQYNGETNSIWTNSYNTNSGWNEATPFVSKKKTSDYQLNMNSAGNAIVVFRQYNGNQFSLWVKRYIRDLGWNDPEPVETENSGDPKLQRVVIASNGNAVMVWRNYDDTMYNVFTNTYSIEDSWGIEKLIEEKNNDISSLQIATGVNGNTTIVWSSRVGIRYQLWAIQYSDNAGWGEAQQINID